MMEQLIALKDKILEFWNKYTSKTENNYNLCSMQQFWLRLFCLLIL